MKHIFPCIIFFLLFIGMAAHGLSLAKTTALLEEFEFQGQKYSLVASFSPEQADILLKGKSRINLSAGMDGENILLGTRIRDGNFYVFWLNYRNAAIRLAFYDFQRNRSRVLPLAGFSSIGLPEAIAENGGLRALVFLGNRTNNVDVFHYEPENKLLTPLTQTHFSEKSLSLREKGGWLEIETSSLWAKYRYRFDRKSRQTTLLEKRLFPPQKKSNRSAAAPEYYNTYIGFGDSITWGQIQGVQRLDLCYLTQMRSLLAETYGPAFFINLGIPAQGTYDGALRVNDDLNKNPALYFLLMLGVNDVWNKKLFDKDSSLENLAFIINTALARNMRVIVSTLTPRKDYFANFQYYWDNLNGLSAGIIELARNKGTVYIDTLKAFMDNNPPDGWKELLEDIIPGKSKGNHPNAAGHRLIASLFAPALVAFPPQVPQNIMTLNPEDHLKKIVQWDANFEADFSHFNIEFGFQPQALKYSLTTAANHHTFALFPFLPQLYLRIQSIDRGDNRSAFSAVVAAQAASGQ